MMQIQSAPRTPGIPPNDPPRFEAGSRTNAAASTAAPGPVERLGQPFQAGRLPGAPLRTGETQGLDENYAPLRKGFRPEQIEAVLAPDGKLTVAELIRCRVRHFADGARLGARASSTRSLRRTGLFSARNGGTAPARCEKLRRGSSRCGADWDVHEIRENHERASVRRRRALPGCGRSFLSLFSPENRANLAACSHLRCTRACKTSRIFCMGSRFTESLPRKRSSSRNLGPSSGRAASRVVSRPIDPKANV